MGNPPVELERSQSFVHAVAQTLHARLLELHAQADGAALPDIAAISGMLEGAFWASLRREEGYTPTISLAYVSPGNTAMQFSKPISLQAAVLAKLAPAVERPGIHLGVWPNASGLEVWGATRDLPPHCFVLEVIIPGLLVAKYSPAEQSRKFINMAVLQGNELKVLNDDAADLPGTPALVKSLLGFESATDSDEYSNVLVQLAVSMRAHGRGGTMLVVPAGSDDWQASILHPIAYSLQPPNTDLACLMQGCGMHKSDRSWQDSVRRSVAATAGLTAVDGATVITSDYEVLAFGAKITRREGNTLVERVLVTEPVVGFTPSYVDVSQLGGTRHSSAAQFVFDQRDAIALVASHDGQFTVFAWSPQDNIVHAHRVEALLL